MYSQNHEDDIILMYFKSKVYPLEIAKHEFTLLEIGANDGKTFSNSLRLIEAGFKAVLVEPSPRAFQLLEKQHAGNESVTLHNFGFALFNGTQTFYESGGYQDGDDVALYSSLDEEETKRWEDTVKFQEVDSFARFNFSRIAKPRSLFAPSRITFWYLLRLFNIILIAFLDRTAIS